MLPPALYQVRLLRQAAATDQPPTVGPIQNLPQITGGDRAVAILLWPNASPDRPPATEMQIDIEPRSFIGDWETKPEGQ